MNGIFPEKVSSLDCRQRPQHCIPIPGHHPRVQPVLQRRNTLGSRRMALDTERRHDCPYRSAVRWIINATHKSVRLETIRQLSYVGAHALEAVRRPGRGRRVPDTLRRKAQWPQASIPAGPGPIERPEANPATGRLPRTCPTQQSLPDSSYAVLYITFTSVQGQRSQVFAR
jgi:hypothetical protein